jgi:hypothetical protein
MAQINNIELANHINEIAQAFFEATAELFPIAAASDEFYFFPQVTSPKRDWSRWDNFSNDAIEGFTAKLVASEGEVSKLKFDHNIALEGNLDLQIDLSLLASSIQTLREQLSKVRHWQQQPTFHLTIACLGIAEALDAKEPAAAELRAKTLPDFIKNAKKSLRNMPVLFRDLGLSMLRETHQYFLSLLPQLPSLKQAIPQLESLGDYLRNTKTLPDFRMPPDLTASVIQRHLDFRLDFNTLEAILDQEIDAMKSLLAQEAKAIAADVPWDAQIDSMPLPIIPLGGLVALYRDQVQELADHCMALGIVTPDLYQQCPVQVLPVPDFLSATRTASSYSVYPQHPPKGGTFYVIGAGNSVESRKPYQREYKILTAHETYPGHHFLDCKRLQHKNRLRRSIEKPLFYEGWACFAEMLMQKSGYLENAQQRMLLARRRLWRAVRGKIDLGLQTGSMSFKNAVEQLVSTGIDGADAAAVVRKYPLNPGYQLCYTIGFKRFSELFQIYGGQNLPEFVNCAVSQGEIDFQLLQQIFRQELEPVKPNASKQ